MLKVHQINHCLFVWKQWPFLDSPKYLKYTMSSINKFFSVLTHYVMIFNSIGISTYWNLITKSFSKLRYSTPSVYWLATSICRLSGVSIRQRKAICRGFSWMKPKHKSHVVHNIDKNTQILYCVSLRFHIVWNFMCLSVSEGNRCDVSTTNDITFRVIYCCS